MGLSGGSGDETREGGLGRALGLRGRRPRVGPGRRAARPSRSTVRDETGGGDGGEREFDIAGAGGRPWGGASATRVGVARGGWDVGGVCARAGGRVSAGASVGCGGVVAVD